MRRAVVNPYRVLVALLLGTGFTALICLLLRLHIIAALFLYPAGLFLSLFQHRDSAWAIMAVSAVTYSAVAYYVFRNRKSAGSGRTALRLALPALLLTGFAFSPKFNLLLPEGMRELAEQETELSRDIPDNTRLEQAREILRSKNIQFHKEVQTSARRVLERDGIAIDALAGDRLVFARFPTNASVFVCAYDLEIYLLYDAAAQMKRRYIHRFRVCM